MVREGTFEEYRRWLNVRHWEKATEKKRAMGAEGCKDSAWTLCWLCEGGQTEPLELVRQPSGTSLSLTMEQENEEEEDTVQASCMNSLDQMDHYL